MNFSNFTAENFTGVKLLTTGQWAVVVQGSIKWVGETTEESATERLNDYIN